MTYPVEGWLRVSVTSALSNFGFDLPRLRFALHTGFACVIALLIAVALGLEHPQWAGMSVWAAALPLRGQLLEKSAMRVLGTIFGTIAGVCLVLLSSIHLGMMIIGLALWMGLCIWGANMQRGLPTYGVVLAGYTAATVALLETEHPDRVWLLAADRLTTVLTGVLVVTVMGYYFSRKTRRDGPRGQVLAVMAEVIRFHLSARTDKAQARAILGRLAAVDEALEPQAAGSNAARRRVRVARRCLLTVVPLLLRPGSDDLSIEERAALASLADALEANDLSAALGAIERVPPEAASSSHLKDIHAALADLAKGKALVAKAEAAARHLRLHRDGLGARDAGLRAFIAVLITGAVWMATGWQFGGFMVLGLAVVMSIFSSFEDPSYMMRHVLIGQIIAGISALTCHILLWPHVETMFGQVMCMVPFVFLGALLTGHQRSFPGALDFNLVFLLLSQPHMPFTANVEAEALKAFAVISTPAIAWGFFALVIPVSLSRRRLQVVRMMQRDLSDLAASTDAPKHHWLWESRFYHRALRFIRLSDKLGRPNDRSLEIAQAMLVLSEAVLDWQRQLAGDQLAPRERRILRQALARMRQSEMRRETSQRSLELLSQYVPPHLGQSLARASRALKRLDVALPKKPPEAEV